MCLVYGLVAYLEVQGHGQANLTTLLAFKASLPIASIVRSVILGRDFFQNRHKLASVSVGILSYLGECVAAGLLSIGKFSSCSCSRQRIWHRPVIRLLVCFLSDLSTSDAAESRESTTL